MHHSLKIRLFIYLLVMKYALYQNYNLPNIRLYNIRIFSVSMQVELGYVTGFVKV